MTTTGGSSSPEIGESRDSGKGQTEQSVQKRAERLKMAQKGSSLELMLRLSQGNFDKSTPLEPTDPLRSNEEIAQTITDDIMGERIRVWKEFDDYQANNDTKWISKDEWNKLTKEGKEKEKQDIRLQIYAQNQADAAFSQIQNPDAFAGLKALGLNLSSYEPDKQREAFEDFLKGAFYDNCFSQNRNSAWLILNELALAGGKLEEMPNEDSLRKQVESLKPFLERLFGKEQTFKTLQTLTDLTIARNNYGEVFKEEFLGNLTAEEKEKIKLGCGGRSRDDEEKLLGYLNIAPAWGQWREKWKEEEEERKAKAESDSAKAPTAPEPPKPEPTKPTDLSKLSVPPLPLGEKKEESTSPDVPPVPPLDLGGASTGEGEKKDQTSGGRTEGADTEEDSSEESIGKIKNLSAKELNWSSSKTLGFPRIFIENEDNRLVMYVIYNGTSTIEVTKDKNNSALTVARILEEIDKREGCKGAPEEICQAVARSFVTEYTLKQDPFYKTLYENMDPAIRDVFEGRGFEGLKRAEKIDLGKEILKAWVSLSEKPKEESDQTEHKTLIGELEKLNQGFEQTFKIEQAKNNFFMGPFWFNYLKELSAVLEGSKPDGADKIFKTLLPIFKGAASWFENPSGYPMNFGEFAIKDLNVENIKSVIRKGIKDALSADPSSFPSQLYNQMNKSFGELPHRGRQQRFVIYSDLGLVRTSFARLREEGAKPEEEKYWSYIAKPLLDYLTTFFPSLTNEINLQNP